MRIQHNIMAMNAYRNYNNNTSALSKNLEKLSSGYKINRAGDDAAGLAISEKMRAQITGLEAAQKNVKDGVNLVKTAEGAMQEIQDMLKRMKYLATQSANGTFDNEVDRANLNKEVTALKTEINRIADSANFNGIKLLDGSLAAGSKTTASGVGEYVDVTGMGGGVTVTKKDGVKGEYETGAISAITDLTAVNGKGNSISLTNGDTIEFTFNITDNNGVTKDIKIKLTVASDDDGNAAKVLKDEYGTVTTLAGAGSATQGEMQEALRDALKKNDEINNLFKVETSGADKIKLTSKTKSVAKLNYTTQVANTAEMARPTKYDMGDVKTAKIGVAETWEAQLNAAEKWDGKEENLSKSIITVNNQKFIFLDASKLSSSNAAAASQAEWNEAVRIMKENDISYVFSDKDGNVTKKEVSDMAQLMADKTGLNVIHGKFDTAKGVIADNSTTTLFFQKKTNSTSAGDGGLTLQIGDTADKFNQMKVAVGDMHTKAMGTGKATIDGVEKSVTKTIADIDISTLSGAQEAISVIVNATNYVSSVRGDLGAVQNRLEHTLSNLSVMRENIQDAESAIRDTDVADEMMAYTKNNILIQSAQAMLAQANAVPQGVLQLLQ